jgi:hypothetical protein
MNLFLVPVVQCWDLSLPRSERKCSISLSKYGNPAPPPSQASVSGKFSLRQVLRNLNDARRSDLCARIGRIDPVISQTTQPSHRFSEESFKISNHLFVPS